ncbi:hypothetical protein B0H12DRAFT_1080787 [Mycena haematopus]|nr:hypothetical protein B0H12DRAFT_1080787 [Mycena haematopus]
MPNPPDKDLMFCLPVFAPDPGHEDKSAHDASVRARYYAVVSEEWRGVVTSQTALDKKLGQYPNARTFSAPTWRLVMDLWNTDCERNHDHKPTHDLGPRTSASTARAYTQSPRGASPSKSRRRVAPPTATSANTDEIAAKFAAWSQRQDAENVEASLPPMFYGVSGHNRVFANWDRAMAALKDSPGADLVYAYNEDQVRAFVREEAARMIKEANT